MAAGPAIPPPLPRGWPAAIALVHIKELALADGFHIHIGLAALGQGPTSWAEVLRIVVAPHVPEDSWVSPGARRHAG